MTGVELICHERARQIESEGFDIAHDDAHSCGEMAMAASAYACPKSERKMDPLRNNVIPWVWPWDDSDWKPTPKDRVHELVKAGALIAAEIDRLQRKAARNGAV